MLALSFASTTTRLKGYRGRVAVTGNPVRASLLAGDADRARTAFGLTSDLPVVFVTGGARGAQPINTRVAALLPELLETTQIIHQTGPAEANDDAATLRAAMATWPESLRRRYVVREFIGEELADVYALADIVIGRAGAGSVAQIGVLGNPTILIPLPLSGGGEQVLNAATLGDAGAAVVIPQEDASPERLGAEITTLLGDHDRRDAMRAAAMTTGRPDAAAGLADELIRLADQRRASSL